MLGPSKISTIVTPPDRFTNRRRIKWESPKSRGSTVTEALRVIPTLEPWQTPDKEAAYSYKTPRKRLSFTPYKSTIIPSPMSSPGPWVSSPCGHPPSPWPNSPSFAMRRSLTGVRVMQEPVIRGTQLMGDSMLMRFTKVITGQQPVTDAQRCTRIGLCVSGQNLAQLCWRLRHQLRTQPELQLSDKVLMMCGTNDILQKTETSTMERDIYEITRILLDQNCSVTVLTIPPIPKCLNHADVVRLIHYNHYLITSLGAEVPDVKVVDILPLFMTEDGLIRYELFEEFMGGGRFQRPDLIHWNQSGIRLVKNFLTQNNIL